MLQHLNKMGIKVNLAKIYCVLLFNFPLAYTSYCETVIIRHISRIVLVLITGVAQWAENKTHDLEVVGSSPAAINALCP